MNQTMCKLNILYLNINVAVPFVIFLSYYTIEAPQETEHIY